MAKKEEKENKKVKKVKENKKAKGKKAPKENYIAGVKAELSKVVWPSKKEVLKYTISTIILVIVLVGFFILINLLMSLVKGAFN